MNDTLAPLFEPWTIGSLAIKNRIVMTSMGGTDLFGWMEKNHFDRAGAEFLLEVAKTMPAWCCPDASRCTTRCSANGYTRTRRCTAT